ncbi:unnamed protein product [Callosobruchus maculatus]|uniref:Uncharacterized protein n=1 Tax=Callosobruchus maculatus TaxID=64391 RepID=A0A653C7W9_CALMS|nr:unnamed protein product [Callosobruchus maculatus]
MRSYVDFCGKLKSWISSAKQYNYLSDTFCIKSFYRSFVIFSQCLRCFSGSTRYIRYSLRSLCCYLIMFVHLPPLHFRQGVSRSFS